MLTTLTDRDPRGGLKLKRTGPMLGESHDLLHEFPDLENKIAALRADSPEFARLMDDYDTLDARVRTFEELGTPVADETIEELKKERLLLKDRLYVMLRA